MELYAVEVMGLYGIYGGTMVRVTAQPKTWEAKMKLRSKLWDYGEGHCATKNLGSQNGIAVEVVGL
jgi:hypothetical protein